MPVQVPKTQSAAILSAFKSPLKIEEIAVPQPGPEEVLIKIEYSGVCHSDLHIIEGELSRALKLPLIPGHEGTGKVVSLGTKVTGIRVGERVGVSWLHSSCMNCENCFQGYEAVCTQQKNTGCSVNGSFQEYCVARASHITRIPDNLPLVEAAPILCAGVTVYKGLKETNVRAGQFVTIVGAGGGLGHMAIQYARAMGIRVIAVDAGDDKRKLCTNLGAEHFIDFQKDDVIEEVKKITTLGSHGVLILSPTEKPYQEVTKYTRRCGTVTCIGLSQSASGSFPVLELIGKKLTICGSVIGNRHDMAEALDFAARGKVKCHYKVMKLADISQAFEELKNGNISGRIVLDLN